MGTDWVEVVVECDRVVRVGGEVWVAENALSGPDKRRRRVMGLGRRNLRKAEQMMKVTKTRRLPRWMFFIILKLRRTRQSSPSL